MDNHVIISGILYRNPKPHVSSKHAYFPSIIYMDNGEMLASFVIGEAFEAINMNTYISRSKDKGESWSKPEPILIQQPDNLLSNSSRITALPNGKVVAIMVRSHREDHPDEGLANPKNLGFVPTDLLLIRSEDFGHSWKDTKTMTPPLIGPSFELCSSILPTKDGRWIWPTSTWRSWDGHSPNGMKMVALVSHDEGETWPEYMDVMNGNSGNIIYWESKLLELSNSLLLSVAWTYNEAKGEDLPNHYTISRDSGRTWLAPNSTGIFGQTMAIAELLDGRLLSVYRRMDKPGLWVTIFRLDDDSWINEEGFPLWGSEIKSLQHKSDNMVHDFNELKFGAPCITLLPGNEVFITIWCYEKMVSIIRWFKVTL